MGVGDILLKCKNSAKPLSPLFVSYSKGAFPEKPPKAMIADRAVFEYSPGIFYDFDGFSLLSISFSMMVIVWSA